MSNNIDYATTLRNNTLHAPLLMMLEVLNESEYSDIDKSNAKTCVKLWRGNFGNIETMSNDDKNINKFKYLTKKLFNPMSVSRSWWKRYLYAVEQALTEIYNPYETVS